MISNTELIVEANPAKGPKAWDGRWIADGWTLRVQVGNGAYLCLYECETTGGRERRCLIAHSQCPDAYTYPMLSYPVGEKQRRWHYAAQEIVEPMRRLLEQNYDDAIATLIATAELMGLEGIMM